MAKYPGIVPKPTSFTTDVFKDKTMADIKTHNRANKYDHSPVSLHLNLMSISFHPHIFYSGQTDNTMLSFISTVYIITLSRCNMER